MSSNWYGLTADETIDRLQTSLCGLNASEVQTRLQQFGPNEIAFVKTPAWIRFLRQSNDPMVIILLITAGITGALSLVAIELDKFVRRSKGQYGVPLVLYKRLLSSLFSK